MSDWKQRLKEAKEMLDLGGMTPEEFDVIRKGIMAERGFSSNPPVNVPTQADPLSGANSTQVGSSGGMGGMDPFAADPLSGANATLVGNAASSGASNLFSEPQLQIGQYTTIKKLGLGGMGAVYRARHQNENIAKRRGDVAIKLIQAVCQKVGASDDIERFCEL